MPAFVHAHPSSSYPTPTNHVATKPGQPLHRASPGGAAPFPSRDLDDALETTALLGLGSGPLPSRRMSDDPAAAAAAQTEDEEGDDGSSRRGASDMPQLLARGRGPSPSWSAGGGRLVVQVCTVWFDCTCGKLVTPR